MKVLWIGDAAVSTGFARCTHAACDALHAAGHEVNVLGINYYGDPHSFPYPIHPCVQPLDGGRDGFGVLRLQRLLARLEPDVVVILNDPWNVAPYFESMDELFLQMPGRKRPKVVGWLAVDGINQDGEPLNRLDLAVTWTAWALGELQKGGFRGAGSVVPLGVDTVRFRPLDKKAARAQLLPGLPEDAFLVGVVGRNQMRKRLDLTLEYFAEWIRGANEEIRRRAGLFMHVAPTGENGVDLRRLAKHFGLGGRVRLFEPPIGTGAPDDLMPLIYNCFDVYLTTTQGEGWGLPALEAMACGVPVVAPDWSGLGGWAWPAARLVDCAGTAPTAPVGAGAGCYILGGIPDRAETIRALDDLFEDDEERARLAERGLELASEHTWDSVAERFAAELEAVVAAAPAEVAAGEGAP